MLDIQVISVSNPIRTSGHVINCKVVFSHLPDEELDFSATSYDDTPHGMKLWEDLNAGVYGEIPNEVAPNITVDQIDEYRDKLIDSGIVFKGKTIQTRAQDRENIGGACTLAMISIMNGVQPGNKLWHGGTTPFKWICSDNSTIELDAFDVLNLGKAIASYKQSCIFAARSLKNQVSNGNNVPNYKDASNWPSNIFT